MEAALYDAILGRLLDENMDGLTTNLIDSACRGGDSLAKVLADGAAAVSAQDNRAAIPPRAEPVGAYLTKLQVAGFRGIGAAATLTVAEGPGLTLVLGRNGSGKSSFAEALETLVTGGCARWEGRPQFQGGWRNLHQPGNSGPRIEATFATEGSQPIVVTRKWTEGAELGGDSLDVRRGSEHLPGLEALGWQGATKAFRPFLSHSELSALLEQPSTLYDQLKGILGLEEITTAVRLLTEQRKRLRDEAKEVADGLKGLRTRLETSNDPRARGAVTALSGRKWKLDDVEKVLRDGEDKEQNQIGAVRALARLEVPDVAGVAELVARLRTALDDENALAATSASQNEALAHLLEQALGYRDAHGGNCPVCGGALGETWQEEATLRAKGARDIGKRLREVRQAVKTEVVVLGALVKPPPPEVRQAEALGFGDSIINAWLAWADVPSTPRAWIEHLNTRFLPWAECVERIKEAASARVQAIDDSWRPISIQLGSWLARARQAERDQPLLKGLEDAVTWLSDAEGALRDARFEPIATQAQQIWNTLRQQSNVDLAKVSLEGKSNRRHVGLNVTVDGKDSMAVSVMSQGEINALALSLFLPRMTLPGSPFRFVVIDDPVQAMDPSKVDGLARALETVAKTRQVIVFTHDVRLFDAIRRLKVSAKVLEVSRRSGSGVEVSVMQEPIDLYLDDAWAIACAAEKLGPTVTPRLVATFCRGALEAACMTAYRRRRLGKGEPHNDVEYSLRGARGAKLFALALLDDAGQAGQVLSVLNNRFNSEAADVYQACKEGAHGTFAGGMKDLVNGVRTLAHRIQTFP